MLKCQRIFSSHEDMLCVIFSYFSLMTQLCQKKQHIALLNWSRLQKDENFHVNLFLFLEGETFFLEIKKNGVLVHKLSINKEKSTCTNFFVFPIAFIYIWVLL